MVWSAVIRPKFRAGIGGSIDPIPQGTSDGIPSQVYGVWGASRGDHRMRGIKSENGYGAYADVVDRQIVGITAHRAFDPKVIDPVLRGGEGTCKVLIRAIRNTRGRQ